MVDSEEIAREIFLNTIPSDNNKSIRDGLIKAASVVEQFDEEMNNWFRLHDVRVYDDDVIGIVADWKWTIERWAAQDMEQWLTDRGWEAYAHRYADRDKKPNEAEFRFHKEYGNIRVFLNCYIEFTARSFEAMDKGIGDTDRLEEAGEYKAMTDDDNEVNDDGVRDVLVERGLI